MGGASDIYYLKKIGNSGGNFWNAFKNCGLPFSFPHQIRASPHGWNRVIVYIYTLKKEQSQLIAVPPMQAPPELMRVPELLFK
jgi:hypothetical protein